MTVKIFPRTKNLLEHQIFLNIPNPKDLNLVMLKVQVNQMHLKELLLLNLLIVQVKLKLNVKLNHLKIRNQAVIRVPIALLVLELVI